MKNNQHESSKIMADFLNNIRIEQDQQALQITKIKAENKELLEKVERLEKKCAELEVLHKNPIYEIKYDPFSIEKSLHSMKIVNNLP